MRTLWRTTTACALLLMLWGGTAGAQSTNYWTNSASGTWNWNETSNWVPASIPTNTVYVHFTNNAASAYTVQFTNNVTSYPLRVTTDKVTFDLNGKTWTCPPVGYWYGVQIPSEIAWNAGETSTVTFSSSLAGGYVSASAYDSFRVGTNGIVRIDTSLGGGIRFYGPYALVNDGSFTVSGAGAIYEEWPQFGANRGQARIEDGGLWTITGGGWYQYGAGSSLIISNTGKLRSNRNSAFGGTVLLVSNGVWSAEWGWESGGINVGYNGYNGTLIVDGSTFDHSGAWLNIGNGADRGQVYVQNGGMLVSSNASITINAGSTAGFTNMLVLNGSTIRLGSKVASGLSGVPNAGVLTNRGILRASGLIMGQGTGPFLLQNEGLVEIGGSLGTLTLSNGNYVATASSTTLFEFDETGNDLLYAPDSSLTFLGTNQFALAPGAQVPAPGAKYGLGEYTFLIASNVTYTPVSDNLTALLGSYGLIAGPHYTYGLTQLGDGTWALKLNFVPEPSTVLLLGLGGLLAWRRIAKRTRR
ncbi:PEP-CTERM sorting domain-containing protein [bacterium]|nr:PEP-CTERM sorting domain-containing protein [bacterium]